MNIDRESLECFSSDPSQSGARSELIVILANLIPPPNYRVVLDVDPSTETLSLKVMRRHPQVFKIFGKVFWTIEPNWDDDRNLQRRLTARTYVGLLTQLKERPEFIEFELIFDGSVRYQVACDI